MKSNALAAIRTLKTFASSTTRVLGLMATVVALISSPYVYQHIMRPDVKITAGAVASLVPVRLQAELMMIRMPLMTKSMSKHVREYIKTNLKELGMPRAKIDLLIQALEERAAGKDAEADATEGKIRLSPQEEKWLQTLLAKAAASVMDDPYLRKQFAFPSSVAFFELRNTGRTDATDMHMVMKLHGSFFSDKIIEAQNIIVSKKAEADEYQIDLKALSPGARVKGMVWYDKSDTEKPTGGGNSITVTYQNGLKEVTFGENAFFTKE